MVRTYGLTHLALAVRDPERSVQFCRELFGVRELYRDAESIQVETPGAHDVIGLEKDPRKAGKSSGISHFGFRLVSPNDVSAAAKQAEAAGGHVLRQGEFVPGGPYRLVADPDDYEVEIWYE